MKKFICTTVIVLSIIGIFFYQIITEPYYIRIGSRVYSKPLDLVMHRDFDTLKLSGKGIKIGVLDAGFGGFKTNKWLQNMEVAGYKLRRAGYYCIL